MYNKDRPVITKEEALIKAKDFGKEVGCDGEQWLQCLRKLDAESLETLQIFYPVDNTEFLPLTAQKAYEQGKFNKGVDLLAGIVKDEGSAVSLLLEPVLAFNPFGLHLRDFQLLVNTCDKDYHNLDFDKLARYYFNGTNVNNSTQVKRKLWEFAGDLTIKCPTYHFAKGYSRHSSADTNVYFYELTHTAYKNRYGIDHGVHHTADLELVLGHPLLFPNTTSEESIEFSKEVMKLFTDFAKTGLISKQISIKSLNSNELFD